MVIELMEVGKSYRLRTKNGVYLTGTLKQKTVSSIQFITFQGEDFVLDDSELAYAKIYIESNERGCP